MYYLVSAQKFIKGYKKLLGKINLAIGIFDCVIFVGNSADFIDFMYKNRESLKGHSQYNHKT